MATSNFLVRAEYLYYAIDSAPRFRSGGFPDFSAATGGSNSNLQFELGRHLAWGSWWPLQLVNPWLAVWPLFAKSGLMR